MFVKKAFAIAGASAVAVALLAGPAGAKTVGAPITRHDILRVTDGSNVGTVAAARGEHRIDATVTLTKGLPAGKYQARLVNGDLAHPSDAQVRRLCNLVIDAKGKGSCTGHVKVKRFGPAVAVSIYTKGADNNDPSAVAFLSF